MIKKELFTTLCNEYKSIKSQYINPETKYLHVSQEELFNKLLDSFQNQNYKCKLIDNDMSVTDLRILFDSNEYDIIFIDTVHTMSMECKEMIYEFLSIYSHDVNRQMCTVELVDDKLYEATIRLMQFRYSDIGDEGRNDDSIKYTWTLFDSKEI